MRQPGARRVECSAAVPAPMCTRRWWATVQRCGPCSRRLCCRTCAAAVLGVTSSSKPLHRAALLQALGVAAHTASRSSLHVLRARPRAQMADTGEGQALKAAHDANSADLLRAPTAVRESLRTMWVLTKASSSWLSCSGCGCGVGCGRGVGRGRGLFVRCCGLCVLCC